ncbi:acyltransferase family protein [Stenotrophomonas sp. CFBP8980]|uniref:acyltransferase family protein n=1 Tax=Stenotrophomonas sp. CFBP8980 TaxID=3096523 RepID=UPI002A6A1EAB|nr:acyltransferase family protein [Stenotrophomonas sp. CFBP8980]MDY1034625.1 acyltransferase family protein [Stenotrophomonas sp. CFBP8980]
MQRRNDLDALRVFALLLLIPYHVAMAYVAEWDFHLKSSHTFEWLQWPMIALNRWRMPLLFVISGIALGLALPVHGRWRFALRRSGTLLLPLLFGIVAVVSLQAYCEAVENGGVAPGLWAFLLRYWQFRPWPGAGFAGAEFGFTWNHLWYLAYLIPYSLLLIALSSLLRPLRPALPRWAPSDRAIALVGLLLPVAWLAWTVLYLLPRHPPTHALVHDAFVHAESLPLFALGFVAARWQRGWELLLRWRRTTLALALLAMSVELGIRALGRLPGVEGLEPWVLALPWATSERLARALYTWTALLALFGWAHAWLDRPFRWLPYAREAVFCIYILHQTVLILLLYALRPLSLGAWLEPALVLGGTFALCLLLHEGLIRRSAPLRPLFGVRSPRRATWPSDAPDAVGAPIPRPTSP